MRVLFPNKVTLAGKFEQTQDPATMVELLSVSDADLMALEPDATDPAPSVVLEPTTTAQAPVVRPPAAGWKRAPALAAVAALIVAVAGGGLWVTRRPPEPEPAPPPVARDPPPPPPPASPPAAAIHDTAPTPPEPAKPAPVIPPSAMPNSREHTAASVTERAPAKHTPKRSGWLKIETYPWAHVRDGSADLGITPLRVELSAGRHRIELENDAAHIKRSVSITIRPGEETRYSAGLDTLPE
jgi:hypothetical protein